jgi:FtsP/CotA-like multicopper oxidase with cupredoxin domain
LFSQDFETTLGWSLGHLTFRYANENNQWVINGRAWEQNRIDAHIKPGATEIWTIENLQEGKLHPVHLHGVEGQILDPFSTGGFRRRKASPKTAFPVRALRARTGNANGARSKTTKF